MVLAAVLAVAALILVNAVYVAAEFAAVSARRSRIRQRADEGHPLASWLAPILETPASLDRYIAACQIGITVSGLALGAYAQATIADGLTPWALGAGLHEGTAQSFSAGLVLLILTVAQVIFAELVPRSLALRYPTQAALYAVVPMAPSLWVYRPLITSLNATGLILRRLLGAPPPQAHRHIHSPEEIELLFAESRDGGLLEPDEHRRLRRALRLNMRQAKQLMVPRTDMSAIDVATPLDEVIGLVARSPYSRLPVYRDSIDNVIGMLHTKDLVRWLVSGRSDDTLAGVIRPVTSIHESVTVDRVLRHIRERRTHQALVVDEFGGTAGLITLEDVLSELLGDVGDEFKSGEPVAETLPDGRVRLPGQMPVEDAAIYLGTAWDTDAATVNGFVTAALGHLPSPQERIVIGEFEFEVEDVRRRALVSVLARRMATPASPEDRS